MHAFHIAPEPSTCYHCRPYSFRRIALARGEILFFDHNPWLTHVPVVCFMFCGKLHTCLFEYPHFTHEKSLCKLLRKSPHRDPWWGPYGENGDVSMFFLHHYIPYPPLIVPPHIVPLGPGRSRRSRFSLYFPSKFLPPLYSSPPL